MYFPLGWPKYLSVGQGQKSKLKHIACNRYRMLFAVLTETTVSIWHCKPCVEIVCYQRCHSSVAAVGNHEIAEWRQDSSMLAVSTTEGYMLLYQLEQDVRGDKGLSLYEYHQTRTNQSDSNETIPALRLTLSANVNFKSPITSLSCAHDDLLVTLKDGTLHLLFWEDPSNKRKSICLSDIWFSVDMQLAGLQLKNKSIYAVQAVYSLFLEGFGVVLSDGRAALIAFSKAEAEARHNKEEGDEDDSLLWNAKGIWAPGINQATCLSINNKYRLMGFGTKRGDCCVYAFDDVTRSLILSHTIALSPTHYPNICNSVGSVLKTDWSPDGCALALSWESGGFSVWSVFGACLVCTLASDRAYKTDGTPVIQGVFKSMCWAVEGYQLWLVGDSIPSPSNSSSDTTENEPDDETDSPKTKPKLPEEKPKRRFARFRKKPTSSVSSSSSENISLDHGQLLQLQFVKSALAMNPCMSNHFHVLLHSEDKIYLSSGERHSKTPLLNNSEKLNKLKKDISSTDKLLNQSPQKTRSNISPRRRSVPLSSSAFGMRLPQDEKLQAIDEDKITEKDVPVDTSETSVVGNKQWTVIPFPINYLPSNWPIRFAAVDETCSFLAIAGNFGLAHYTVISRKWKVFGNVTQEKDMVVTGGLTWWEDFIVVACHDLFEHQDELRIYPRLCNLDNAFACRKKLRSQVLLVNVFRNFLILFTYDCRILIFIIARDKKMQRPMATVQSLQEIPMARFVPYPTLVVSVAITALYMESATRRASCSTYSSRPARETEVIIVNVAGRLLLLQRSLEGDDTPLLSDEDEMKTTNDELKQMKFTSPVVLASCVENIWTTGHKNRSKVHLTDALWLSCGGAGLRVWLPLFPPRQKRHRNSEGNNSRGLELQLLTARRITLSFSLDSCYPLSVLFNEAVILGVTSETLLYQAYNHKRENIRNSRSLQNSFQYSTVERTCEIYLHQILRQLLRRNLGYHALELAATCKNLSCFPHVLELMLHEVLEEEATASEPIPDPLLPTVIKFLEEFPEYLQTVVHCARKTEIALWEYLFNSVGSPRDLFEECFKTNQLQTAASYLIILQNLEQLSVARQDATKLFDQALQNHMWGLANDIARFLRAIGDGDAIAAPRHPTLLNTNIYPAVSPASLHPSSVEPEASFKFSASKTQGNSSPTTDYPPSLPPKPRRVSARSYTESFLLPNKTNVTSSTSTPTSPPLVTSSISNSFVPRYSVRQYHQNDPVHKTLQHSLSNPVGGAVTSRKRLSIEKSASPQTKEHAASECAEHYFIDVILARQARKMLTNKQLHRLGTFAAYVDFQLVPWLKKERNRAAKVDDPVACLNALHSDFDWPYPAIYISKSARSSISTAESPVHSHSFNDLQTLQKNLRPSNSTLSPKTYNALGLKSLHQSFATKRNSTPSDNVSTFSTEDDPSSGVLTMLTSREMGSNLTLATVASEVSEVMSETSYTFDESNLSGLSDNVNGFLASGVEIDDRRGPPRSEMKLQYLLELFLETRCLEWALLICIMLKDSSCMARLLRSCEDENLVPLDTLQRTRDCLVQIDQWAVAECSGYKAVLVSCRSYVHSLYDLTNAREVAHAENEAMKAKQHQRMGSNQSVSESERHVKVSKTNSNPSATYVANQTTAKKQLFEAVHDPTVLNGTLSYSSDTDIDESPIRRQGSLENRNRPKSLRTRHNSVPCNSEISNFSSGDADVNLTTPTPDETELIFRGSNTEKQEQNAEFIDMVSDKSNAADNVDAGPQPTEHGSTDSDRFSSTSGSTDDENSGCLIS